MPTGLGCDTTVALNNVGTAPVSRTYNGTPSISFLPFSSGPAAGGSFFAITGQNLGGATATIGGNPVVVTS